MNRQPIRAIQSRYVFLPRNDVDTDQIIPARFLTTTTRTNLGAHAFHDWRHRPDGSVDTGFPLNRPGAQGAAVLVVGENFGCGSSREHAAWALNGLGLAAVVARSFADIFRANAIQNGLLPVAVSHAAWGRLQAAVVDSAEGEPLGPEILIDLAEQTITLPGEMVEHFEIDAFSKRCLLDGTDTLGFLLSQDEAIAAYEQTHPSPISGVIDQ